MEAKSAPLKTGSVLTITERAAKELKTALESEKTETYAGLRLGVEAGGCCGVGYSLAFSKEVQPGDMVVESGGVKVFIGKDDQESLKGAKVDFIDTPMGSGFHIDNPNLKSEGHGHGHGGGGGCGCGGGGCGRGSGGHGHGGDDGCGC